MKLDTCLHSELCPFFLFAVYPSPIIASKKKGKEKKRKEKKRKEKKRKNN